MMETTNIQTTIWSDEHISLNTSVKLYVRLRQPSVNAAASDFPALVLLHFWGGSNATWDAFALCTDPRHSLIIPSLRGWGESSAGPHTGSQEYKSSDYASDICALLDELQARSPGLFKHGIILMGHSLGAKVAQHCLITLQEHQNQRPQQQPQQHQILGLVLVAPSPACGFDFGPDMLEKMHSAYTDFEKACHTMRTAMLGARARQDTFLISSLGRDAMRASKDAVAALPSYGAQEDFEDSLKEAVTRIIARGNALRVLVIEGDERLEGADVQTAAMLAKCGAQVRYERVACGHLIPIELPKELAALVDSFVGQK